MASLVRARMHFDLPNDVHTFDDPSFFTNFLILQWGDAGVRIRGCEQAIAALATIHWTWQQRKPPTGRAIIRRLAQESCAR
jgi:hypothetical protein